MFGLCQNKEEKKAKKIILEIKAGIFFPWVSTKIVQ